MDSVAASEAVDPGSTPGARTSFSEVTPPDGLLRAPGLTLFDRREFDWGLLRAD